MEEPSPPEKLSLGSSETVFSFPPHRRRPLRSRTYYALIGILSHCRTNCPQPNPLVDSGDARLRLPSVENEPCTRNEANPADISVALPNNEESQYTLIPETSTSEDRNGIGFQDGGSDRKQASVPRLDPMNLVKGGEQEVVPANRIVAGNFLMVENQTGDCAIQIAKEQENANSVLDMQMDEFDTLGELKVDEEFSISEFSEALNSCFGIDMVVESSKAGEDSQEHGTDLEENVPKEAEHELQLKEMELEKLLYNSGAVESTCCLDSDEEIEEGEIPGAADAVFEDAASLGEKTAEMAHASEDTCDKEKVTCIEEDRGQLRHEMSDPSLVNIVNIDSNCMTVESSTAARQMQDCHSQDVFHDSQMEAQRSVPIAPCLENLNPNGRILQDNAAESQKPAAAEKDDNTKKKKRKHGPLTKERRAKKKKKERLKRAEKNRKLGVNRLKLQTILKPKKKAICCHYLQGRCHEGEKCNFSHDAVPETKSKPCSYFARHSCMKGDDCPFDHQLSKYPCNNFTSNGFCSRGSDCLFSHQLPANQSFSVMPNVSKPGLTSAQHTVTDKGGSSTISKVTKPEMKFPPQPNNSNSSKHMDNSGISHQKADAKFCSTGKPPVISAELFNAKPVLRTAGQAPKGVSFLSNRGLSSLSYTSSHKQDTSMKNSDGVDVGCKTILKMPGGVNKTSNMSDGVAPRKPRGVNFLSFAQRSSDVSTSEMFPNLLSSSKNESGKSVTDDMGKGKLTCSLPQSVGMLKVNREMNQTATNLVPGLNGKVDGTPMMVPQHLNFLYFDKTSSDDSILKEGGRSSFNKGKTTLSFAKERQCIQSEPQDTTRRPSLSFDGLRGQSTRRYDANLSSSFKTSLLSNTPSSVQKAVQSTLSFAAKFESDIKVGSSLHQQRS